jgi:regulator of RNase E activity RraA
MNFKELKSRYDKLQTAAVGDVLDGMGFRNQNLPWDIQALSTGMRLFGKAFTITGRPAGSAADNDMPVRVKMLSELTPGTIAVMAADNFRDCAHWGEIMSFAARNNGCLGAVVDGGTRDVRAILDAKFPVFCRFRSPSESTGRWNVSNWQTPIKIENVEINPDDYILGDEDGVIVIPSALVMEALIGAEEKTEKECCMREALFGGGAIEEVFKRFGHF